MSETKEENIEFIEPENDEGNKEYKLKLTQDTQERINQWTSQMRYRVDEGGGEAIYVLGITDEGGLVGMIPSEYTSTRKIFDKVVKANNYTATILSERIVNESEQKKVYEFLIRENNEEKYIDLKVAIAGNVNSSKSSTIGVLLSGKLDNGRGSARLNVFNYEHEAKTGRSSSVAQHILGFDEKGEIVNQGLEFGKKTWPEIIRESTKVVTFFDLCGHEKYLKTTIRGLTSQFPDLCLITVGGNMGITRMTKEHIFLCLSLKIPFLILITKIDICEDRQNVLKETITSIKKLLKLPGIRRIPYTVRNSDDVVSAVKNFHTESIVPIIQTSNVTGVGLDILTQFLNLVSCNPKNTKKKETKENKVEYHVETTFSVPGVGTVTGGQLLSGTISVGDKLLLGPNNNKYRTVQVRSIHCKRVPMQSINAGCYVCLALKKINRNSIRRGNVIISPKGTPLQIYEFEADVSVLKSHSTTIKIGYEPVIHTSSVRQTAKIIDISNKKNARRKGNTDTKVLRTGDKATVRFRFSYHAEYVKPGYRLLLAEGKVKIIGIIRKIF